MANRNGLVIDATTTLASDTAEREAAPVMAGRSIKAGPTLGGGKGYDVAGFVKYLRDLGVTPHVARKNAAPSTGAPRVTPATR